MSATSSHDYLSSPFPWPQYRYVRTEPSGEVYAHVGCPDGSQVLLSHIPEHNKYHADNPPPEPVCSICGDPDGGILTDVRVIIADGEEGYADITQLLCEEHLILMQDELPKLGFRDHRHGGINFLEDPNCPGTTGSMHDCPTPTGYGGITVPGPGEEWPKGES